MSSWQPTLQLCLPDTACSVTSPYSPYEHTRASPFPNGRLRGNKQGRSPSSGSLYIEILAQTRQLRQIGLLLTP